MNGGIDELAKRLEPAAPRLRALRKLGIVLASLSLAWGGASIAWAEWTPPESSVTPPAVVTLDIFENPEGRISYPRNGYDPLAALVVGWDGALYGSTTGSAAICLP